MTLLNKKELFPDDAHSDTGRIPVTGDKKVNHQLVVEGAHVVCISCPYLHTIPVDLKKWKVELGNLVRR